MRCRHKRKKKKRARREWMLIAVVAAVKDLLAAVGERGRLWVWLERQVVLVVLLVVVDTPLQ